MVSIATHVEEAWRMMSTLLLRWLTAQSMVPLIPIGSTEGKTHSWEQRINPVWEKCRLKQLLDIQVRPSKQSNVKVSSSKRKFKPKSPNQKSSYWVLKSKLPLQQLTPILSLSVTPANVHIVLLCISSRHRGKSSMPSGSSTSFSKPSPLPYFPMCLCKKEPNKLQESTHYS